MHTHQHTLTHKHTHPAKGMFVFFGVWAVYVYTLECVCLWLCRWGVCTCICVEVSMFRGQVTKLPVCLIALAMWTNVITSSFAGVVLFVSICCYYVVVSIEWDFSSCNCKGVEFSFSLPKLLSSKLVSFSLGPQPKPSPQTWLSVCVCVYGCVCWLLRSLWSGLHQVCGSVLDWGPLCVCVCIKIYVIMCVSKCGGFSSLCQKEAVIFTSSFLSGSE